jgi:hypothetical protein
MGLLDREPKRTELVFQLVEARTGKLVALCPTTSAHAWASAWAFSDIVDLEPDSAPSAARDPDCHLDPRQALCQ